MEPTTNDDVLVYEERDPDFQASMYVSDVSSSVFFHSYLNDLTVSEIWTIPTANSAHPVRVTTYRTQ
jgi:protease II